MTNPNEPRQVEDVAVTLVRMEGKLDNVAEKVSDLRSEVSEHRGAITLLQSDMQQVKSDAANAARALLDADKGREDLAKGLKDADEKRVADAKAIVDQSTNTWMTPMRVIGIFGTFVAAVGVLVTIYMALTTGTPG